MTNQTPEEMREKFEKKEWKHWSSFQSKFVRLPDSCKKEIADYWLAKIAERDAMMLATVEARMLLSDFPRDEKTIDDVLSTLSEVMGRE